MKNIGFFAFLIALFGLLPACTDFRCYREDYVVNYGNGCISACSEGYWMDVCPTGNANVCDYSPERKRPYCYHDDNFVITKCDVCEYDSNANDDENGFNFCDVGDCY